MKISSLPPPPTVRSARADAPALHRSGAVARMLRMPVATLRVWERRYALTAPALSPAGQRLYSTNDVRRLVLIKQLKDLGHAIGSLAPLDFAQLQSVAETHATVSSALDSGDRLEMPPSPPGQAWRFAVIGASLGARLHRPSLIRRLAPHVKLLGPFVDVAQAADALKASDIDAVLIHAPQLNEGWSASFEAAAPDLAGLPRAVLYGFAADSVCDSLAAAGVALLRAPQPDAVVAQWLQSLSAASQAAKPTQAVARVTPLGSQRAPQRRWDDAALAEFAGLTSTVACECPRHVAELLVQLANFEAYCIECEHRSTPDAELHAYLSQVAAASRARFEAALEQVALHEGLVLPASRSHPLL